MLESGVATSIVVSSVVAPVATSSVVAHAQVFIVIAPIVLFIVVAPVEVVVIRVFAIFVTAISVGFDIVAGVTNGEMAVENASCSGSYCT
jgi:hypothetical protein